MSVFYTEFPWQGQTYWLKYNFDAMKTLEARYPGVEYTKVLVENYAENVDMACDIAHELMSQGEMIRRRWGYPDRRVPSSADLRALCSPVDFVDLVVAVVQEIIHGNGRNDGDDEEYEYDPWLLESEKKKNYLLSLNGHPSESF